MVKAVLFQTIQFSVITQFCSTWSKERTLSRATTPGQSGSGSDSNEWVLRISQSSSITWTLPSNCLVGEFYLSAEKQSVYFASFRRLVHITLVGEFYPSAETQSVYSTAPADWAGSAGTVKYDYTFCLLGIGEELLSSAISTIFFLTCTKMINWLRFILACYYQVYY